MNELEKIDRAAAHVRGRAPAAPAVGIVLGSGLGRFAEALEDAVQIPYAEIPGFVPSSVEGHRGVLWIGRLAGLTVAALQGRVHLYEGHRPAEVVLPLRVLCRLGAARFIVSNAAGGINPAFRPGDLMVIEDHLNLTGQSPLTGPNLDAFGPRFPDMSEAYDRPLRRLAFECADAVGIVVRRGVYAGLLGPSYETPAEIRMLRTLGADAVGMSTVLEVVALRHAGAKVLGLSCISNLAAGLSRTPLSHAEVAETAKAVEGTFLAFVRAIVARMAEPGG